MQRGGDVAAHGGFARTDLAGQQPDAAQLDEVLQARLGLAPGARVEQLVGMGGGLEREPGQGEVSQVHQFLSLSLWIARGEGDGSRGGWSQWSCQEGRWRLTAVLA